MWTERFIEVYWRSFLALSNPCRSAARKQQRYMSACADIWEGGEGRASLLLHIQDASYIGNRDRPDVWTHARKKEQRFAQPLLRIWSYIWQKLPVKMQLDVRANYSGLKAREGVWVLSCFAFCWAVRVARMIYRHSHCIDDMSHCIQSQAEVCDGWYSAKNYS